MRINSSWLREWVNYPFTTEELVSMLTMAGLEVEAKFPVAAAFSNVFVAEISKLRVHPNASRLWLCEINAGSSPLVEVVCGAENVRVGLKVAFAQVDAKLPGRVIKAAKLRGVLSQGMLCSAAELGLTYLPDASGILELADDAPIGSNLREYLVLDDEILDIDLTPNRGDCLSVLGIAREVAALANLPLQSLTTPINLTAITNTLPVKLQADAACPKYCGRIIENINTKATTPTWLKERLYRAGLRSLHPIVDITNYVMLELGQPLHAFDLNKLAAGIIVRFSEHGEKLVVLGGQEVQLKPETLIIADHQKPIAIAGIIGGEHTAVHADSNAIFLESAFFRPETIAKGSRLYNFCTDAAQRYERGVDPMLQNLALERTTALILAIVGGQAGPITAVNTASAPFAPIIINFKPTKLSKVTGIALNEQTMLAMLNRLGMEVDNRDTPWQVKIPSYRFDLNLEVDLVEEILRLYGYDKVPPAKIITTLRAGSMNHDDQLAREISRIFVNRDYNEIISYSFVHPELQKLLDPIQNELALVNPMSAELAVMRRNMWPGLLAAMIYNLNRQQTSFKFFEHGIIFAREDQVWQEHACVAGLLTGQHGNLNWSEQTQKFDFYDLKGDLEAMFASLKLKAVNFLPAEHSALHPGKTAKITVNAIHVGWCGALNPRISANFDLADEILLFELRLALLRQPPKINYNVKFKFPKVRRDLSLLVDKQITSQQIITLIKQTVDKDKLKELYIFDNYSGNTIPKSKKSLGIAIFLHDQQKTLVDAEVNVLINSIIKKLAEDFAITLRN